MTPGQTSTTGSRRATVVGTGLIGASVGLALRDLGWQVTGHDRDQELAARAVARGALDATGIDSRSELVVIVTPVGSIVDEVRKALAACPRAAVTDVGGVKRQIVEAVDDPRFVGGHPMAGSEQLGLDGADASLFDGAVWVLTPSGNTSDAAFQLVREVADSFGAEVLTIEASRHDELVAVVSHVPHLTAAALVTVARDRAEEHRSLLRLAAGGFRDMTRIAAGSPTIWPDVCEQNRAAIVETLDRLLAELGAARTMVAEGDRDTLLAVLGEAQEVRRNLPSRPDEIGPLAEVRVPIPDRPGALAAVAVLATDQGINLRSVQTIDTTEAVGGVVALRVAVPDAEPLREALVARGYRAIVHADQDEVGLR